MGNGRWTKIRINFRTTAYFVSRKSCLRECARIPFQKPIYSFSRRCNSINSFVRRSKPASRRTMLRLPRVSASRAHCTWHDNTWMRNYSTRYVSVPTPAYKSMLSEKRKRDRGCKKRIESSAMAKRYISNAIVIGERRIFDSAAFVAYAGAWKFESRRKALRFKLCDPRGFHT